MDAWTWVQSREDAAFPSDAARQTLARALRERANGIAGEEAERSDADRLAERRAAIVESASRLFGPMTRYVRGELGRLIDLGEIEPGMVEPEDVVISAYLRAVDEAATSPEGPALYPWLRRIARNEVSAAVRQAAARARREASLETPVEVADDVWPDRVVRLIDVLADPRSQLPEEVIEHEATRRLLNRTLAKLPERWREMFLLSAVDGWSDSEIARVEGVSPREVGPLVDASRAFLREWLQSEYPTEPRATSGVIAD